MVMALPSATLWDLDGTLVDSERYWIRAEQALIAEHGGTWTEERGRQLVGNTLSRTAEIMREAGVQGLENAEIIDRLGSAVRQQVAELGVPWRPGALELLQSLHQAGIPNALVTMSYSDNATAIVDSLPFEGFQAVVSGDQVRRGKPDPEAYRTGASLLGVHPADCVAFEDSVTGMRSAVASGACTIVVPNMVPIPTSPAHLEWDTLAGHDAADAADAWRRWRTRQEPGMSPRRGRKYA